MTDAGGSDRLCSYFKMCESDPIDKESVTTQLLTAGTDVEMGGGSLWVLGLSSQCQIY
jgi:beta-glucosidase